MTTSSSINTKHIIDSNNNFYVSLNADIHKGNESPLLYTVNEMNGNFYDTLDEFYRIISKFRFLDLNVVYSNIVQESGVLQYNEIFMKQVNDFFNKYFNACLNNYYKNSPIFFNYLFPIDEGNNMYKNKNTHQYFQKYYYLLCIIEYTNVYKNSEELQSLPLEFVNNITNWCITRNDPNIEYQLIGPKRNQVIKFDFISHYHTLLNIQNTTKEITEYNKLVKLQNINDNSVNILSTVLNRDNVYDKTPDNAREYTLNIDTFYLNEKEIDSNNRLIFDLSYIDYGDTSSDESKARLDEININDKHENTLHKLNVKRLEEIFNKYSRIKVSSMIINKDTYITNLKGLNKCYLVFDGITCSDRTIDNNDYISGNLTIPGTFKINEQNNYEFIPLSDYTTYRKNRTRIKNCKIYLYAEHNIIPNIVNIKVSKNDFYNVKILYNSSISNDSTFISCGNIQGIYYQNNFMLDNLKTSSLVNKNTLQNSNTMNTFDNLTSNIIDNYLDSTSSLSNDNKYVFNNENRYYNNNGEYVTSIAKLDTTHTLYLTYYDIYYKITEHYTSEVYMINDTVNNDNIKSWSTINYYFDKQKRFTNLDVTLPCSNTVIKYVNNKFSLNVKNTEVKSVFIQVKTSTYNWLNNESVYIDIYYYDYYNPSRDAKDYIDTESIETNMKYRFVWIENGKELHAYNNIHFIYNIYDDHIDELSTLYYSYQYLPKEEALKKHPNHIEIEDKYFIVKHFISITSSTINVYDNRIFEFDYDKNIIINNSHNLFDKIITDDVLFDKNVLKINDMLTTYISESDFYNSLSLLILATNDINSYKQIFSLLNTSYTELNAMSFKNCYYRVNKNDFKYTDILTLIVSELNDKLYYTESQNINFLGSYTEDIDIYIPTEFIRYSVDAYKFEFIIKDDRTIDIPDNIKKTLIVYEIENSQIEDHSDCETYNVFDKYLTEVIYNYLNIFYLTDDEKENIDESNEHDYNANGMYSDTYTFNTEDDRYIRNFDYYIDGDKIYFYVYEVGKCNNKTFDIVDKLLQNFLFIEDTPGADIGRYYHCKEVNVFHNIDYYVVFRFEVSIFGDEYFRRRFIVTKLNDTTFVDIDELTDISAMINYKNSIITELKGMLYNVFLGTSIKMHRNIPKTLSFRMNNFCHNLKMKSSYGFKYLSETINIIPKINNKNNISINYKNMKYLDIQLPSTIDTTPFLNKYVFNMIYASTVCFKSSQNISNHSEVYILNYNEKKTNNDTKKYVINPITKTMYEVYGYKDIIEYDNMNVILNKSDISLTLTWN